MGRAMRLALAGVILAVGVVATADDVAQTPPIAAQGPSIAALAAIEPGEWQLSEQGGERISLCVADPRVLLQLRHGAAHCSRFVVANEARSAIVNYTCPGAGRGRTAIDIEAGGLFKLQTQGILDGAPFDVEYQARRIGDCSVAPAAH